MMYWCKFAALQLCTVLLTVLGVLAVPLALLVGTRSVWNGERMISRLHPLFVVWDNPYDGADGDKRLWWAGYCLDTFKRPATHWFCRFVWLAVRNPVNYWKRQVLGVDVSQYVIERIAGADVVSGDPGAREWQILRARAVDGRCVYRVFVHWAITDTHSLLIDIGHKIKLAHNDVSALDRPQDRYKGTVLVISPWKEA